jgi:hypothetical protein
LRAIAQMWRVVREHVLERKDIEAVRSARTIRAAACGLWFGWFLCCPAPAQAPAPSSAEQVLDYHSDILVEQDASLLVRETIRVRSEGQQIHHGIYRDFPTRYRDHLGNRYVVGFKLVQVSRDGRSEDFHVEDQYNGERIYVGDENVMLPPGEYTYALVYTVNREIGFFADHEELYWNVTGTGWLFPIAHASATVKLPSNIPGTSIRMDGYTGRQGSRGKAFGYSVGTDNSVSFASSQPLSPGEGLTIVVSWPKGYVEEPSGTTRLRYFVEDNRLSLVGCAGLTLVLLYYVIVWFKVGRSPAKSSIMPIYQPPAGISPAAMRYLVRMGFDDKTFAVAVIDMAVKKFLSIKENDSVFTLHRTSDDKKLLAPEESAAATGLFGKSRGKNVNSVGDWPARSVVVLKPNSGALGSAVAAVKKSLHDAENKVYFVANQRYIIPGLILSAGVLGTMVAAETGGRGYALGFLSLWLIPWSFAVFFLVARVVVPLLRGLRTEGGMKRMAKKEALSSTLFALPFVARRNRRSVRDGLAHVGLGGADPGRTGRNQPSVSLAAQGADPCRARSFRQD